MKNGARFSGLNIRWNGFRVYLHDHRWWFEAARTPSETDLISRSCYPRCSWNVHGQDTSPVDIDPPKAHVSILRGDVAEGAPWLEPVEIEVWRGAHVPRNFVGTGRARVQRLAKRSWLHAWFSHWNLAVLFGFNFILYCSCFEWKKQTIGFYFLVRTYTLSQICWRCICFGDPIHFVTCSSKNNQLMLSLHFPIRWVAQASHAGSSWKLTKLTFDNDENWPLPISEPSTKGADSCAPANASGRWTRASWQPISQPKPPAQMYKYIDMICIWSVYVYKNL